MGPELELKSKCKNIQDAFPGQKILEPRKNYTGYAHGMEKSPIEQTPLSSGDENVEVNITGCTNSGKTFMMEDSCEDVTEGSSSFGDTGSGTENASSFNDTEVESQMHADNASLSMCDGWRKPLQRRKKTMANHWRRFIGPIMWRCKWIELRLKQLQSQELKYDNELVAYNHTKQLDFAHLTLDGSDIKSVPISGRIHKNKVMKRNKRRRVEETCDLASYMSNHNLFSYYEKTGRTVDACLKDFHCVSIGAGNDNNEEFKSNKTSSTEDENNDKSLNDIIHKIEGIQSEVHKLKNRIDKLVSEHPQKFCSVTQLSMHEPYDGFNLSDLNFASLAGNENTTLLQPEFRMGDLLMPRNAPSRLSPIIEATDGSELEDTWEDTKNGVLAQNHDAEEDLHYFNKVRNLVHETNESENAVHNVHSTLKSCSAAKSNVTGNKRKGSVKSSGLSG